MLVDMGAGADRVRAKAEEKVENRIGFQTVTQEIYMYV